jgi:hypothetical protein
MYTALAGLDASSILAFMPKASPPAARQPRYAALTQALAGVGWISEGYVQDRGPGAGGPHYQWTRKVKGKTVSVALSAAQYQWLKTAIENWRHLQATLKEMQRLSREELFETIPGPPRRKPLSKAVLGTN